MGVSREEDRERDRLKVGVSREEERETDRLKVGVFREEDCERDCGGLISNTKQSFVLNKSSHIEGIFLQRNVWSSWNQIQYSTYNIQILKSAIILS